MPNATISGWGKCIPPATLSNTELAEIMDTTDEWITTRTGIHTRHISHVNTSVLASVAAQRALAAAGCDGRDLDLIILATTSPDTLIPNIASTVQAEVGARCGAFDLNAACSGFLYGVGLAAAQIRSGHSQRILVVGAERLSYYIDWSRRETAILFGDAAGAVVLEADDDAPGVLEYALNNDPDGRENLHADFGTAMDRFDPDSLDYHIHLDGQEVFKKAVNGMKMLCDRVLEKQGFSPGDVDLVIPHQANARIISALGTRMKVPSEKIFVNIARYGNTSAATIPVAICDALEAGHIRPGSLILSCAFGAGLTSAAVLLRWGRRTDPIAISPAELPPCDQTGRALVQRAVDHFCGKR
jgi:3-oxoacyl-[acyl-carrier-protein] synthase-3